MVVSHKALIEAELELQKKEIISKLVSSLVEQKIDIYGVHQTQASLEQVCKEVTR